MEVDTVSVRTYHVGMGKSLKQLVREYLERLAGSDDAERDVAELRRPSRESRGHARRWRFNRAELHERA